MGAFLTTPVTEKISENAENEDLICGGSSMQGWRSTQEDAHNCVLNFDKETALFAVYDGHGGADVAIYSSQHLPDAIKQTEAYAKGDYVQALKDAFLEFDATLITEKVVKQLEKIAQKHNGEAEEDNENGEEDEEESVNDLYKEATMPLADVMARYKTPLKSFSDKFPISPFLRGKKNESDPGASSSSSSGDAGCSSSTLSNSESEVSSSSGGASSSKSDAKNEVQAASSSSSGAGAGPSCSSSASPSPTPSKAVSASDPDSSSSNNIDSASSSKKDPAGKVMVNGIGDSVSSSQNGAESKTEAGQGCGGSGEGAKSAKSSSDNVISSSDTVEGKSPEKKRIVPTRVGSTKLYEKLLTQDNGIDTSDSDEDDETFPGGPAESDDDDDDDDDEEDVEDEDGNEDEGMEDDSDELDDEEEDSDLEDEDDDGFCFPTKEKVGEDSGCTAVVALVHKDTLYVANAGDSRCVVSREGKAIEMSFDHKPEDPPEETRIVNAGGKVTPDGRVNGGLNLSRALGDHSYKQNKALGPTEQMISALPDIKTLDIDRTKDDFMVLACDGIWNSLTSQEVVDFVNERLDKGVKKLTDICEELFDRCLAPHTVGDGTGCDNMTCIIVRWKKPGETNGVESKSVSEAKVSQDDPSKQPTEPKEANTVSSATKTETEKRCASPDTDESSRKKSKIEGDPSD